MFNFFFSAREIKNINQNDIGRKVKLRQTMSRPTIPPSRKDTPPMRESLTKPSYQPSMPSNNSKPPLVHSSNNGVSSGLGSNHVSSSRPQNKPSLPDIARRPIKYVAFYSLFNKNIRVQISQTNPPSKFSTCSSNFRII